MSRLPTDPEHEGQAQDVDERRRHPRIPSSARVGMRLERSEFSGTASDLSAGGLLFFSPGDVRLTILIDEEGKRVERSARLVRAQRMRGDSFGWAVEFDPD